MSDEKKYIIYVKEVHETQFEVDALNPEEALFKALNGDGIWLDNTTEFIESLDPDSWNIEEA